jgi:hypothetical protein
MATIPHGFGAGSAPFSGNLFNLNYNHALREAGANAETFGAKNAYSAIVHDDTISKAYLYFMHDGEPFANLEEILKKGLMPNDSGGKGNSLQGAGLTFTASFLNNDKPELAIGSISVDQFIAGKTVIKYDDILGRSWNSEEDPEFVNILTRHFTDKSLHKKGYTVFYRWEIPYSTPEEREKSKTTEEEREDKKGKIRNTLQLVPSNLTDMSFDSGDIFSSINFEFNSSLLECDSSLNPLDLNSISGNQMRRICGKTEFTKRYIEETLKWEIPTGEFDVEIGDHVFRFSGHIEVLASQGERGAATAKSHGDQAWLEAVTENNNNEVFIGRKWKKGSCSREGNQPTSKLYLTMPLFNKIANPIAPAGSGVSRNAYKRFTTNSLYRSRSVKPILLDLGVSYFPEKGSKAFAVVTVYIDQFLGEVIKDQLVQKSINYLDDMLGRRPDFWLKEGVGRLIINQAIKFAKASVPPEMKKWFDDQFPASLSNEVPLYLDAPSASGNKGTSSLCSVIDVLQNKPHSKFNAGTKRWLAIFYTPDRAFLNSLSVASNTRGATLKLYSEDDLTNDKSIRSREKTKLLNNIQSLKVQFAVKDVFIYRVEIKQLCKLDIITGKLVIGTTTEYRLDLPNKVERNKWMPTRSIRVLIPNEKNSYSLGPVVEVPAIRSHTKAKRGTKAKTPSACGVGTISTTKCPPQKQLSSFCNREEYIILQWIEGHTQLNRSNPRFKYFLYPDREGTETQKLCNKIYKQIHRVASQIAQTLLSCEEVVVGKVGECQEFYLEGSMAKYDYPVNQTISRMLDDGWLHEEFLMLAKIREKQIADGEFNP